MGSAPRVLFYVQHLLGIGHLVRASRIAQALVRDGFATTIVMGGTRVAGFPGPDDQVESLPPIRSADAAFSALVDAGGDPVGDDFKIGRRDKLLAILTSIRPDILIIEAFPFGRRQMRFELIPLLDAARAAKTPLIVSSVRDIVQENRRPGRDAETVETIRKYFDLVMVHGDPAFARIEETFAPAAVLSDCVAYTGLVAGEAEPPGDDRYDVIVSAGGGRVGQRLIECACEVAAAMPGRWCIITGSGARRDTPVRPGVEFHAFRTDFPNLLTGATVSVSQAGYNTVCDILRAGVRPVLVPFAAGGETEQTERAQRLAARGLAVTIAEEALTPSGLAAAIREGPPARGHGLDLDGARGTVRLLRERLGLRRCRSA